MYKWKARVILKNGKEVEFKIYDPDIDSSTDVAKKYFTGDTLNFSAYTSIDEAEDVFIRLGDISVFYLSLLEE